MRLRAPARPRVRGRLSAAARQELLWITTMYLAARGLLLLVAYLNGVFGHHNFLHELANWDGLWYRTLANHGYPDYVSYAQTTLGFFPLFPLTIWAVEQPLLLITSHDAIWCATVAGALISAAGGLVATVLVHRLAEGWWNREVARRATILFIVFPGAVVFSMVYSEGLLLPLAAGCIYALERRRWVLAGVLAGFATAVQPVGLALVPVCLLSALLELRRRGWSLRAARRSFLAPLLSLSGLAAFMAFLWAWTGNPLATYLAQHHGWSETTTPLAMWNMAVKLSHEVSFSHFNDPTINLNLDHRADRRRGAAVVARPRLVLATRDLPRGDPVDAGDRVPGLHVVQRAAAAAHAVHRLPGAHGRRPLRRGPHVPRAPVGQWRAAGRPQPADVLRLHAASLSRRRASARRAAGHQLHVDDAGVAVLGHRPGAEPTPERGAQREPPRAMRAGHRRAVGLALVA